MRAWRQGRTSRLYSSSSAGIAASILEFLICKGVPAPAILIELYSTNTPYNALFTADLVRDATRPPGNHLLL